MKHTIRTLLVCSFTVALTHVNAQKQDVLLTIGKEKITVDQFEKVYNKNNVNTKGIDPKSVEEYLELYINFKLKVKEAEALGMDTVKAYQEELRGYVNQLSAPYLVDREFNEELVKEAYNRLKSDVKASHILIKVDKDAAPEDTLKAYNKVMEIRKKLLKGEDFGTLAATESSDPSAKQNKGALGYFSAFRMVYPFETAAYTTKVGEISMPVKTRFGYHLLKIDDKRPAFGEIRAAHIMVALKPDASTDEKVKAEQKINELYQKLQNGEDFRELAGKFSDDIGSSRRGGELPQFGTGRMVKEFEVEAFALKNDNDYSKPFLTEFGWHIVKRLSKVELKSFEEEKDELKKKVERDGRSRNSQSSLVAKLKKQYGVKEYTKSLKKILAKFDSTLYTGNVDKADLEKFKGKILVINDKQFKKTQTVYSQKDFINYVLGLKRNGVPKDLNGALQNAYKDFVQREMLKYEESILALKYPEYAALVQEYRDGILLFELMEKKVWKKAVLDTTGLESFYGSHKNEFMWDKRVDANIYTCSNKANAEAVIKMLNEGKSDSAILAVINKESQLAVDIRSGKFSKKDNSIIDGLTWEKGISKVVEKDNSFYVINIKEILKAQPKKLNEAKGAITSAYQNHLEKQWIKELREKYQYQVNKDAVKLVEQQ